MEELLLGGGWVLWLHVVREGRVRGSTGGLRGVALEHMHRQRLLLHLAVRFLVDVLWRHVAGMRRWLEVHVEVRGVHHGELLLRLRREVEIATVVRVVRRVTRRLVVRRQKEEV